MKNTVEKLKGLLWKSVVLIERYRCSGDPTLSPYCDRHKGYRKAVGGRWGLWKIESLPSRFLPTGSGMLWLPSECTHYPPPALASADKPIQVEDYTANRSGEEKSSRG
jgi:hypothetical protein